MRDYLLGKLDAAAAEALELEYFTSGATLLKLRQVEDGLIRDYLNDALSAEDRARFEARREELPALETKIAAVRQRGEKELRRRRWRLAIAVPLAACLAIAMIGMWWYSYHRHPYPAHEIAQTGNPGQIQPITLVLSPGVARGPAEKETTLTLSAVPFSLRLVAQLWGSSGSLNTTGKLFRVKPDSSRQLVWQSGGSVPVQGVQGGGTATFELNSSLLSPGLYQLDVSRTDGPVLNSYNFRTVAQ